MEKITEVNKYLVNNLKINFTLSENGSAVYDARVEEVCDKSFFTSIPTDKGEQMPFHPGMAVDVGFISTGGRFSFKTRILGRVLKKIHMLELDKPELMFRSEMREFFRIDVMQKVKVYSLKKDTVKGQVNFIKDKSHEVLCMDISGGGAKFLSERALLDIYAVDVDFGGFIEGLDSVAGVIVRNSRNNEGSYDIGIKFTSLKDSDRDKIIKYVFKRQIEMRKLAQG